MTYTIKHTQDFTPKAIRDFRDASSHGGLAQWVTIQATSVNIGGKYHFLPKGCITVSGWAEDGKLLVACTNHRVFTYRVESDASYLV